LLFVIHFHNATLGGEPWKRNKGHREAREKSPQSAATMPAPRYHIAAIGAEKEP
jgi:hypothetical protein